MKSKLNAFTIGEVTIALLITGVVTGMAMFLYEKLTRQTNDWWMFQQEVYDFEAAVALIQSDIDLANHVQIRDHSLWVYQDSLTIQYSIDRPLIRTVANLSSDTLWADSQLADSHRVVHTSIFDTIRYSMNYGGRDLPLTMTKTYSFEQIITFSIADSTRAY